MLHMMIIQEVVPLNIKPVVLFPSWAKTCYPNEPLFSISSEIVEWIKGHGWYFEFCDFITLHFLKPTDIAKGCDVVHTVARLFEGTTWSLSFCLLHKHWTAGHPCTDWDFFCFDFMFLRIKYFPTRPMTSDFSETGHDAYVVLKMRVREFCRKKPKLERKGDRSWRCWITSILQIVMCLWIFYQYIDR